jgi:hypothetical protein
MSKTRGILVLAQNSPKTDYVEQACLLAMSIKVTNPETLISVVTNDTVPEDYVKLFDKIIPIPFNDDATASDWKVENRWKLYHATPYDQTMVLDTDMLVLQDISSWWDFLENYKLYFTTKVFTYRGDVVTSDYYRKAFTSNSLPNLYSGLHYFEKSDLALEFYTWLELVMQNWELFYGLYVKESYPGRVSVDVSAAIVAKILDCDSDITNKYVNFPTFTHMKSRVQGWNKPVDSWQDALGVYIDRDCKIKIGNFSQLGILHYTENDFVTPELIERYRNYLHV